MEPLGEGHVFNILIAVELELPLPCASQPRHPLSQDLVFRSGQEWVLGKNKQLLVQSLLLQQACLEDFLIQS